ncbi:MAG: DUF1743 domain-containing protein [Promethearchaeota archaeon]
MSKKLVQIGFDDIDSPFGGCTTHFASIIVEKLSQKWNVVWVDYPNLIRLNPGIPYRTRGNGAVALRFSIDTDKVKLIIPLIERAIHEYIEEDYPNTNPGVVLFDSQVPKDILDLSRLALWRVVPIQLARRVIEKNKIAHYSSGNGRGLVGALSAVANTLSRDHTYEYIAYRKLEQSGNERGVDVGSVFAMDRSMRDRVFSNIDQSTKRIMIEPHGPDPVLYGVRGETAEDVIEASTQIKSEQSVDRWTVFRTNQGTGEHLTHRVVVRNVRPYMAAVVQGKVDSRPRMIEGGHCIFSISDDTGKIDCAAYEPSGEFRDIVMKLIIGDQIKIHASVRPAAKKHGLTLNIEGLEVVALTKATLVSNPVCPQCGKRMKSAGHGKGYKCGNCGYRNSVVEKTVSTIERNLRRGLYLPPIRAQRHLTKPAARLGKVNDGVPIQLIPKWHNP